MKKHIIAKLLILLLLCISTIGCDKTSSKNIELIKAGKYEEAAIWLYEENMTLITIAMQRLITIRVIIDWANRT